MWDGADFQVAIYPANAEISYPILMRGGQNGILTDYDTSYHYYFLIDGAGVIVWRGSFDDAAMRAAIDAALAPLPVEGAAWGGIKAMYR